MRPRGACNTRQRILQAAETAFGNDGYGGTRLHQVAERVGVQKASLFHYFASKEDLYRAVLEEQIDEFGEAVGRVLDGDGEPLDKIQALLALYVEMVVSRPARTKILLRQSLGDAPPGFEPSDASEQLLRLVAGLVAREQQAKGLTPIDPMALVLGVVGMVAFFFTSGPVLSPSWFEGQDPTNMRGRIERHVNEVVARCLSGTSDVARPPAAS